MSYLHNGWKDPMIHTKPSAMVALFPDKFPTKESSDSPMRLGRRQEVTPSSHRLPFRGRRGDDATILQGRAASG